MPIKFSELDSISYDNIDSFVGLQKDSQGRYYNKLIQKDSLTANVDKQIRSTLNVLFPLGSLYFAMKRMDKCPLEILGVGTWVRDAEDRCIQGSGKYTPGASVEPGLPNVEHTHWISTTDDGLGHKITINSAGNHTHTRGSMNITGTTFGEHIGYYPDSISGAFYPGTETNASGIGAKSDNDNYKVHFDASRTWTGSTSSNGNHTHTLSGGTQVSNIRASQPIYGRSNTVQPPAYVVDVWKRIG